MSSLNKQAKVDRLLCQRSLYYLCKEVLGYKDMVPHVHGPLCDFATNPSYGRYRQACLPRSWFKTWVWTVGKSIWLTLPDEEGMYKGIYPYKGADVRILIASNVIDNAAKMINKIKSEWESNSRLQAAFPELLPDFNKTRWSDHCACVKRDIKAQEGTYTAVGAGGSVISQHFDHIIEDDLIYARKDDFSGEELMPSQEEIDNAIGWHKLVTSLWTNPKVGAIDNIGTRWAPHDLVAYIRNRESKYACFEITATRNAVWPPTSDDDCVWKERYNKTVLEDIRESQSAKIFETQYLNRPRAGEDVTFDISYLKEHESLSEYPEGLRYYTFVDLASWTDKKNICNNVVLTGAKDEKNHYWIARIDSGHYNPTQVIELMKQHHKQFNSKVLVEEVGYQIALRHFAREDMESEGGFHYPIEAIPHDGKRGAKELRIESLEPVVKNGALHILKSMKAFRQEMEDYPYSRTVDTLDCVGFLRKHARTTEKTTQRIIINPFSIEAIEREIKNRSHNRDLPFDIQLKGQNGR